MYAIVKYLNDTEGSLEMRLLLVLSDSYQSAEDIMAERVQQKGLFTKQVT